MLLFAPALRFVNGYWLQVGLLLHNLQLRQTGTKHAASVCVPISTHPFCAHCPWQTSPPGWAADYITAPRPSAATLLLQLLLPLLSTMLWVRVHGCCRMFGMVAAGCSAPCLCIVPIGQALHCNLYCCLHHHLRPCYSPIQHPHPQVRPMCQELLGLSEQQLALVQALALLATAAVMAANVRTLLQRYLDRGLTGGWTTAGCGVVGKQGHMCSRGVALLPAGCHYCIRSSPRLAAIGWHQLKHGSKAARGNREQKQSLGELIRLHCQVGGAPVAAR